MKKIIIKKIQVYELMKKKRIIKTLVNFKWTLKQEKFFETIKKCLINTMIAEENE